MLNDISILAKKLSEYNVLDVDKLRSICKNIKSNCHLAIMNQPYLDNIIAGTKTIESRFTKVRCTPFRQVNKGDILIFKESPGDIIALSIVKETEYYGNLSTDETMNLINKYKQQLTATSEFIKMKKDSKYVSLMHIDTTIKIPPVKLKKSDMRAWIVFKRESLLFDI